MTRARPADRRAGPPPPRQAEAVVDAVDQREEAEVMRWSMTVPCDTCPFRKEGGVPLRPGRVRELAAAMLGPQGGTFPCHKSVDYSQGDDEDGGGFRTEGGGEVHCAGALAFALKSGNATQMMRIAARFGDLDMDAVERVSAHLVWDSLGQWLKASSKRTVRRPKL